MQKEHRSGEASFLLLGIVVLLAAGIGLAIPVLTYGGLGSSSGAKPLANVSTAVSATPSPIATKLAMPMAEAAELPRLASAPAVLIAASEAAAPAHVPMPRLHPANTPAPPPTQAPALPARTATPTRTQPPTSHPTETSTRASAHTPPARPADTATPTLTATASPTGPASPVALRSTATRAAPARTRRLQPLPSPTALSPTLPPPASPPELVSPLPSAPGSGRLRFQWQPTGPLADGAAYEVVIWARNEDPNQARGIAPPTLTQALNLDVDVLFESGQFTDGTLLWTVLVVQTEPYLRLTQPAGSPQRLLIYSPGG